MADLGASDLDGPLVLLRGVKPDVVIYGCTSATQTHGSAFDRALPEQINTDCGHTGIDWCDRDRHDEAGVMLADVSRGGVVAGPWIRLRCCARCGRAMWPEPR